MLKLQFKDQRKPAIWLVETRYAIGKDAQNNIALPDDGVSPFHAEIRVEGDQVFITDTGSSNGTFVNGKRIQRRTELRSGDVIAIHTVQLLLVDPKQEMKGAPEGATAISPALANIPIASSSSAGKQDSGWVLKAKTGSLVGQTFAVPAAGKVVIGRANTCDIQLPANHVSRQHAEVQIAGGKLLVKDLNSSNGTFVNRKKVADAELQNGDEVRFDTFSFEVIGPAGAAPAKTVVAAPTASSAAQPAAAKAHAPTAAAAKAAARPAAAPASSPKAAATPSSGGGAMLLVGVLVIAAAAAVWFFLK